MRNLLNQILDDYQQTEEYVKENANRDEANYLKAVEELAKNDDDVDLLVSVVSESEDFGFILGFKYAMRLQKECGII